MAITRETRIARRARRRSAVRRWTIPVIGGITPVGLIVVNVAAFIVHHLVEFRLGITICAFVSGMLLGSWQALNAYRIVKRRLPDNDLLSETNEEIILLVGMGVVILVSVVTAFFCYQGLSEEKNLPNGLTFLGGAIAIALPFVMQVFFRQTLHDKDDR